MSFVSPQSTLRISGKQNSVFSLGPVIKCLFYCCVILLYKGKRTRKFASILHCKIHAICRLIKLQYSYSRNRWKCSGIINPLFGVMADHTRRHFAHRSLFSQLIKYPRLLSTKTLNQLSIHWNSFPSPHQDAFHTLLLAVTVYTVVKLINDRWAWGMVPERMVEPQAI